MLTRRTLLTLTFATATVAALPAFAANGPDAVITAIYQRVATGAGDSGGAFVWVEEKDRRRYFSARIVKLWLEASAKTPQGDQGPIDFDLVTNSQDPLVKAFDVAIEKQDARTAIVVVHISDKAGPMTPTPRGTIRYDMVLENDRWRIDDIRGAIDTPWSLRKMLADFKG